MTTTSRRNIRKRTISPLVKCKNRYTHITSRGGKLFTGELKYKCNYENSPPATPERKEAARQWAAFLVKQTPRVKGSVKGKTPGKVSQPPTPPLTQSTEPLTHAATVKRDNQGRLLPGSTLNHNGSMGIKSAEARQYVTDFFCQPDKTGQNRLELILTTLYEAATQKGDIAAARLLLNYAIGLPKSYQDEPTKNTDYPKKIFMYLPASPHEQTTDLPTRAELEAKQKERMAATHPDYPNNVNFD